MRLCVAQSKDADALIQTILEAPVEEGRTAIKKDRIALAGACLADDPAVLRETAGAVIEAVVQAVGPEDEQYDRVGTPLLQAIYQLGRSRYGWEVATALLSRFQALDHSRRMPAGAAAGWVCLAEARALGKWKYKNTAWLASELDSEIPDRPLAAAQKPLDDLLADPSAGVLALAPGKTAVEHLAQAKTTDKSFKENGSARSGGGERIVELSFDSVGASRVT